MFHHQHVTYFVTNKEILLMTHPQSSQHSLMRPMVDIHDRMPVILTDENEKGGLT